MICFLRIIEVKTLKTVARLQGRNRSHCAELAYDLGYCSQQYAYLYS